MKPGKKNQIVQFIAVLTLLLSIGISNISAITYTTLANGSYTNTTNVWSTNGINSCGCAPPINLPAGTILQINHNLSLNQNISFNSGGNINVSTTGSITGISNNIDIQDAIFNINGNVNINKLTIGVNGIVNVTGVYLKLAQKLDIYGSLNLDHGYLLLSSGSFNILSGGSMLTSNSSKIDVLAGNIDNSGYMNICSTCCLTTRGNWTNLAGGVVDGNGSAQSTTGNMTNNGTWNINIAWCSVGFDFGMPTPENCSQSNLICGVINLPVELAYFNVNVDGSTNVVDWMTASEINNDHFTVEKSSDAINYEEMSRLNGAGNSNETRLYSTIDKAPYSTTYYRLKQVDFNGDYIYYGPISVTNSQGSEFTVNNLYPNPAEGSFYIDMYAKNNTSVDLFVIDSRGMIVYQKVFILNGAITSEIPTETLSPGIYTVKMVNESTQSQHIEKVIIQ